MPSSFCTALRFEMLAGFELIVNKAKLIEDQIAPLDSFCSSQLTVSGWSPAAKRNVPMISSNTMKGKQVTKTMSGLSPRDYFAIIEKGWGNRR